jgi:ATP-dependent DNA helicase 2 subunit 2
VDFDDTEYGFKEEDKPKQKKTNESLLKSLVSKCENGMFATIAEAIDELDTPRLKQVRPYKAFDGVLTLGNLEQFPAAVSINVERYFKTKQARPVPASTVVVKTDQGSASQSTLEAEEMEGVESTGFSGVKNARTYRVNDPEAPGGKKDVEFESLAKGYEYGRTAVHISESEHNITQLETQKSFAIVGFIPSNKARICPFMSHLVSIPG